MLPGTVLIVIVSWGDSQLHSESTAPTGLSTTLVLTFLTKGGGLKDRGVKSHVSEQISPSWSNPCELKYNLKTFFVSTVPYFLYSQKCEALWCQLPSPTQVTGLKKFCYPFLVYDWIELLAQKDIYEAQETILISVQFFEQALAFLMLYFESPFFTDCLHIPGL